MEIIDKGIVKSGSIFISLLSDGAFRDFFFLVVFMSKNTQWVWSVKFDARTQREHNISRWKMRDESTQYTIEK